VRGFIFMVRARSDGVHHRSFVAIRNGGRGQEGSGPPRSHAASFLDCEKRHRDETAWVRTLVHAQFSCHDVLKYARASG
jgi:hypothetical protein